MGYVTQAARTDSDTIAFALNLIFGGYEGWEECTIEFRVGAGYDAYQFPAWQVLGYETAIPSYDWRFLRDTIGDDRAVRFGPALRLPGTTGHGTKADLSHAACFFVDADGGQDLTWMMRSGPAPTVVTQSSPGNYHFYYAVHGQDAFDLKDGAELDEYEGYQKGLAQMLGCKWMPASQLMRLPGTYNHKYDPPVLAEVVYTDHLAIYRRADLAQFPYVKKTKVNHERYVGNNILRVNTELNAGMRDMLTNPYKVAAGRNEAIFRVACQLSEQGVGMGDAETLINREIANNSLYFNFSQDEVQSAILSGYRSSGSGGRRVGFSR